jgi:anti-sigma factor RsiW
MTSKIDPANEPMVARDATYHRAPDALRERLRASLTLAAESERRPAMWRTFGMAAAFAVVALVSWNVAVLRAQAPPDELLAHDVVTAHVRSLMGETHLNDVVSTDQHTVKPWFSGKLDFAPPVQDLANAGFVLTGGRLDYVNGRPVAALTYRGRQHVVNLFVWPAPGPDTHPIALSRQGYALLHWTRGGMEHWAVSDMAPALLAPLADALH